MSEENDVDIMSINAGVAANYVYDYYKQIAIEHKDVIYAIKKKIYERAKNGCTNLRLDTINEYNCLYPGDDRDAVRRILKNDGFKISISGCISWGDQYSFDD